jgi:predicted nucleic acid-binding protein
MTEDTSAAIVYLDSMTFIFSIEGERSVSEPATALIELLRKHPGAGITSELTLAEVLAGCEQVRSPSIRRAYFDLILWSKFVDLVPINREILCESAELRFAHKHTHGKKLKLPDAIHLVTAIQRRCRYFVSADKGIKTPVDMKKIAPDASGIAELLRVVA